MKNKTKWLIVGLGTVLLSLLFFVVIFRPPGTDSKDFREIIIQPGDGSAKVARLLIGEKIVRPGPWFLFYTLVTGREKSFKAGRYKVSSAMSISEIARILSEGKAESDDLVVAIPEGFNVWEIDQKLAEQGLIEAGEFAERALVENREGYLFPDSYRITNQESQIKRMEELWEKMNRRFNEKGGGKLSREQLIVASILEKEVQSVEDMAVVAGIIYERLKREMPLQIDATVAYGACLQQEQNNNLKLKNSEKDFGDEAIYPGGCDVSQVNLIKWIKIDGFYNTYTRLGLPPGPIANPGQQALEAAVNPRVSDYLYYLSARTDGRTVFSRTAEEHERNRQKYR